MLQTSTITNVDSGTAIGPERDLWIAVLKQATDDAEAMTIQVQANPDLWTDPSFREEAMDLRQYFQSQSMDFGGFGFICDLMDLDPEKAAKCIHEKYLRHLVPLKERSFCTASLAVA